MKREGTLAIVEDDPFLRDQLFWALKERFDVKMAGDATAGLSLLDADPDVLLVDLRLPPSNQVEEGFSLVRASRERRPETPVIVMSGEAERKHALKAVELGAFDFFKKPFDKGELLMVVRRALERRRLILENRALREESVERHSFESLVGKSAPMRKLFRDIGKVSPTDATVLIHGESGTGKELVARALHQGSARAAGPFVAVNGSALPESLAESELFGHEKGAFTGAVAARAGRFESAHRGTLFLDEVATLSAAVQAKLLRVLETRSFERVGGTRLLSVDIRLVAATNEDLEKKAARGEFREDLFYRLNTVILGLPPLRERREDIPILVDHFAARAARAHGRPPKTFAPAAMEALLAHPFRGNVRELEHLVEMLTVMVEEPEVRPEHLPGVMRREAGAAVPVLQAGEPFPEAVARFERELLVRALEAAGGVKAKAARALGLDTNQMKYLCRKYGI